MQHDHLGRFLKNSFEAHCHRKAMRVEWTPGSWTEYTYAQFWSLSQQVATGLLEWGVGSLETVGIFSQNRPEWSIVDLATLTTRCVSVPIYATNTAAQAEYIIKDAALKVLFVGDSDQYDKVADCARRQNVRVVVFDDAQLPHEATTFSTFLKGPGSTGHEARRTQRLAEARLDDLATIIYTSGTTGDPKGVMLTHDNYMHQFRAIRNDFDVGPDDRSVCFLPLSHSFERAWSYYLFACGGTNTYLPDPKRVVEYLSVVKPTAMVSVPRLYEKIYGTIQARLENAPTHRRWLFNWAVKVGRDFQYRKAQGRTLTPLIRLAHRLADRLVLHKIRAVLGGEKNFLSSGGAALSAEIEEFFFAVGILVCQGFGLTETSPVATANTPKEFKFGTVGKPVAEVEIKIGDNEEILIKGPNVMRGYLNKPQATEEAFIDGWFRTGDQGRIDEEGYLIITGRIKDLIITSQGKNIAPQHIELVLGNDLYIEQLAVVGDKRPYVTALVVPNFPELETWGRTQGLTWNSREELAANPHVLAFYKERIDSAGTQLAPYEQVKRWTLLSHEFSQEGGELTPTLKIKRNVVQSKYADLIDRMYAGSGAC